MATQATMDTHHATGAVEHQEPNYIAIFIYLAALTGVELVVYSMNFPTVIKVGLLVALALAKAVLVAMYFMHLATERPGLWIIAAIPLVLVAFCYLMLRPDLSARAWTHVKASEVVGQKEGAAAPAPAPSQPPANATAPPS